MSDGKIQLLTIMNSWVPFSGSYCIRAYVYSHAIWGET